MVYFNHFSSISCVNSIILVLSHRVHVKNNKTLLIICNGELNLFRLELSYGYHRNTS